MKLKDPEYGGRRGYKIVTKGEGRDVKKYAQYRVLSNPYMDGGRGFRKWVEEFCCGKINDYNDGNRSKWVSMGNLPREKNRETGRSYYDMWNNQCDVMDRALETDQFGNFRHNLIVLCHMRGDGKSFITVLVQLWKFFVWPHQLIVFGANSKEQSSFVHFDIARDIILNSPRLLRIIGEKNILHNRIRLLDDKGDVQSSIRAISTATGIVSNITGFTFSEMFDMKNPKFYEQLYGSIRNMPNALGTIDSTVSDKQHVLYDVYMKYMKKKSKMTFFHHRQSPDANAADFWHPNMTQKVLDEYRLNLSPTGFDQYFRNTWEAGSRRLFTDEIVRSIRYAGIDGVLGANDKIKECFVKLKKAKNSAESRNVTLQEDPTYQNLKKEIKRRLIPVSSIYKLVDGFGFPGIVPVDTLQKVGELYKTDFAILVGVDRSDPMKAQKGARTICTIIAKGLPNSKNNADILYNPQSPPEYVYFLVGFADIESASLEDIKSFINSAALEYDGVDSLCSEKWGMWDIKDWCEENMVRFEAVHPSYNVQRAMFSELFILCATGRFKSPPTGIRGSKQKDLFFEELALFDHDPHRKWYGSPEKRETYGIQDDSVYSVGWAIYGGREIPAADFRERGGGMVFGEMIKNNEVLGAY